MNEPFIFATASALVEITGRRAQNLEQLLRLLREADGSAIFHHTYQTLREHHMLIERYPNDFAQWVHEACGEESLAERMAGVDLREFKSLRSLRERLVSLVEAYLAERSASRTRPARKPFNLCSSITVVTPTGDRASTIPEFRDVIVRCSIQVIHHHFITARLRVDLAANDFSVWLAAAQQRPDLAERIDRIDLVMRTMDEIRSSILETLA